MFITSAHLIVVLIIQFLENSSFMHHLKVKTTRSQSSEKRLLASSCVFACPSVWKNSAPNGRVLMKKKIILQYYSKIRRENSISIKI